MKLSEKQAIFARYFAMLIQHINSQPGYRCAIGEVERPSELQELYLKLKKTKAKDSFHEINCAGDLRIFKLIDGVWVYLEKTQDYLFAGLYWESLDPLNVWGGRFGDKPETEAIEGWDGNHFQYGK